MIKREVEAMEIIIESNVELSEGTIREIGTMRALGDMLKKRIETTPEIIQDLETGCPTCKKKAECRERHIARNIKAQEVLKVLAEYEAIALGQGVKDGRQ